MKLSALLFLFLFSQLVFSEENDCQKKNFKILDTKFYERVNQHLNWSAASSIDVKKTSCKTTVVPSLREMEAFIQTESYNYQPQNESEPQSSEVNGVVFEDESPVLIKAFEGLTTAYDSFGINPRSENQINLQTKYSINPGCKKVKCALDKIWGEEFGSKLLYILMRHHFNASELAYANSDRFTPKELDDVIMGLEDLPNSFKPLGQSTFRSFQRLAHFKRGAVSPFDDSKTYANSVVMLFDMWSKQKSEERQYTVFHELSHNISFSLGKLDESSEWLALSSWVKVGDNWKKAKSACMASRYGSVNPDEDWAESVSAYRYNSVNFKNRCPEKYNYLKEVVFKGIEYTSDELCK